MAFSVIINYLFYGLILAFLLRLSSIALTCSFLSFKVRFQLQNVLLLSCVNSAKSMYVMKVYILENNFHIPNFPYLKEIYTQFPSWHNRISIKPCALFLLKIDHPIVYDQALYFIYVYNKEMSFYISETAFLSNVSFLWLRICISYVYAVYFQFIPHGFTSSITLLSCQIHLRYCNAYTHC
jgi:hypothetical protein